MALVASSIVFMVASEVFISGKRAFYIQEDSLQMQQELYAVMDSMSRNLRMAGYKNVNASCSGIYPAESNSTCIKFSFDYNQDGKLDGSQPYEKWVYRLDREENVLRGKMGNSPVLQPLAQNIREFELEYVLHDGQIVSDPDVAQADHIRMVSVGVCACRENSLPTGEDNIRCYNSTIGIENAGGE